MADAYTMFDFYGLGESAPLEWSNQFTRASQGPQVITPKDVIRQAICFNMQQKGQEIPVTGESKTVKRHRKQAKHEDLSEEMLQRRKKNREAAQKCRMKKRKTMENLEEKAQKYRNLNRKMEHTIQEYQEEKAMLEQLLKSHVCTVAQEMVTTSTTIQVPPSASPPLITDSSPDDDDDYKSFEELFQDLAFPIFY